MMIYYADARSNVKSVPCPLTGRVLRGQRTLAWAWPDQTLVVQELIDRQAQLSTPRAPGQRVAVVSECPGQRRKQYCKRLVLSGAQARDTGYYRCYYKDVKAIIDGTTAVSVYVFVRGEPHTPPHTHKHSYTQMLTQTRNENRKNLYDSFTSLPQHKICIIKDCFSLSLISF